MPCTEWPPQDNLNIYINKSLDMDLRRSRPSYKYKSYFGPPAGIIMVVIVGQNNNCSFGGAKLEL